MTLGFLIPLSFTTFSAQLPELISTKIIEQVQQSAGAEYHSISLMYQQLPDTFSQCESLQFTSRKPIHLGKQYIKFMGCGISKQLSVTVTAKVDVPVAKHNIQRNVVLSEDHLVINTITTQKKMKYFLPVAAVIGRTTKRQIREQKTITENLLEPNYFVTKGSLVSFVIAQQGFVVSTEMLARENGLLGQKIRLQHPISKKRVAGIVTGVNTVSAITAEPQIEPVVIIKDKKHHIK